MREYRCPEIAKLAAQLRRGPKRLIFRHLWGIDFLLSVIQSGHGYPLDFIVHSLTGYRAGGCEDSPLLEAGKLTSDLIELAEDLSAAAELTRDAWVEPTYTVNELAERFDVSTKTIFRWHRRGLVGWRVRMNDGRSRLVFADHSVRRFVAQNVVLVARGSSFTQLSEQERAAIVERARQLVEQGRSTVNAVAKAIAGETGRAVETIRLILKNYDQAHPRSGVFNRPKIDVAADDDRLRIWEAYLDGASVPSLARRFERSGREIYRILTEMRARDLQARDIEYVASDEFAAPDADRVILEDPDARQPYVDPGRQRVPRGLPPYLQQLFRLRLLSPAGERALFRKMNYLKYKADQLRKGIDPEEVTARELDRIDALLAEAERIKSQIVEANLRLVVSIAKRHASADRDFFEVVSDGNVSLMRAVERFDYSRGFKFSTYASWAIMRNYARTVPQQRLHRDRYQTGREELLEHLATWQPDEADSDQARALRQAVERMLASLDEREESILRKRFGLDGRGGQQTLEQIGKQFGVSKERIRQLEARAMRKLRDNFGAEVEKLINV